MDIEDGQKKHNKTIVESYLKGAYNIFNIANQCDKMNIKFLTIQCFSYKSLQRKEGGYTDTFIALSFFFKNIDFLLGKKLFKDVKKRIKIKFIGEINLIPKEIRKYITNIEKMTKYNKGLQLNLAIMNGRRELIYVIKDIAKKVKENKLKIDKINEDEIEKRLFTRGISNPDLLIPSCFRPTTDNFLIWQIAFTPIICPKILWPDFTIKDLRKIIFDFKKENKKFINLYGYD